MEIFSCVAYCVEVYNITCGRRNLVISDCNVTEPSYTSDVIMDGYIYEYTITPRSNVPGARNGTSLTLQGMYTKVITCIISELPEFVNSR